MRESLSKATFWKVALAVVVALLGTASVTRADSIVLISSGSGAYNYGYSNTSGSTVFFGPGQGITLSGMSGVTGASVTGGLAGLLGVVFISSSEVIFNCVATPFPTPCGLGSGTTGNLNVFSPESTGTVDWSAFPNFEITGTVQGPVAPAPEPTSVALLLLGIGLVFAMRKRIAPDLTQAS